jgi:ribosomal protein S18 acetylase RimI-like enzyme
MAEPLLVVRFDVDDAALTALHARAFGGPSGRVQPWAERLRRHSVSWVGAFDVSGSSDASAGQLIGFVHACWDGGVHAFLLDAVVAPEAQGRGVGRALVRRLTDEVRAAGCEWLHVDYEPRLDSFYRSCGFRSTMAGLIRLAPVS